MNRDIWGVFHDGEITKITGTVPGDLRVEVEIGYLRKLFPEPGHSFVIELRHCTKFEFREYGEAPSMHLAHIQERRPMILYVTSQEPLILDCSMGNLELDYQQMEVFLPSGRNITEQELSAACDRYWCLSQEKTSTTGTPR